MKSRLLQMRIDPELMAIVDEFAQARQLSRSDWVRSAIVTRIFAEVGLDRDSLPNILKRLKNTSTFRSVPDEIIALLSEMDEDQIRDWDDLDELSSDLTTVIVTRDSQ